MTNNSSTGGPLLPTGTPPLEDAALDDFFQQLVVGLTNLPGNMVRPRWQAIPPNMPKVDETWAAVGVVDQDGDFDVYTEHDPNGADLTQRHEVLGVLCSFYGPGAGGNAALVRDGLSVGQNREVLQNAGMGLIGVDGGIRAVPSLINNQWYRRLDMRLLIRRQVLRSYPVLNIASAQGTLYAEGSVETFVETIIVEP